jgi:hypothetical protein
VFQRIPREHRFECHDGLEKLSEQSRCIPIDQVGRRFVAEITPPLSHSIHVGRSINIKDISMMRITYQSLISLMEVKDIGEHAPKTMQRNGSRKGDRQFSVLATFGELEQLLRHKVSIGVDGFFHGQHLSILWDNYLPSL